MDLIDAKLDIAKKMGADVVINSGKQDVFEEVNKATNGEGADKVFETAGSPVTIAQTPNHYAGRHFRKAGNQLQFLMKYSRMYAAFSESVISLSLR
ncbi:zinc-binding dehydrogenase [Bilifractor porci]|jgi:threonine dehydrogenase-like Zn-dependent dehydrogenase|uniref:zinc-binding dehydrogenase n=1 Tax=Bilifractor porci TaxID=2606636 RepID=UPI001F25B926|nr:zinc-binding dehydrogenase [Bilifractor porci]